MSIFCQIGYVIIVRDKVINKNMTKKIKRQNFVRCINAM